MTDDERVRAVLAASLRIGPDEVLIIVVPTTWTADSVAILARHLAKMLPGRMLLIQGDGVEMAAVSKVGIAEWVAKAPD